MFIKQATILDVLQNICDQTVKKSICYFIRNKLGIHTHPELLNIEGSLNKGKAKISIDHFPENRQISADFPEN